MSLTDLQLRRAKPEAKAYKITDGAGLYIEVKPTGARLWRYRYRIAGKENAFALGEYPEMTLAAASEARDQARKLVRKGISPARSRQIERLSNIADGEHTFESIAREFMGQKAKTWSAKYSSQFTRAMEGNVFPVIGKLPIRSITSIHILDIMRQMDKRGATTYALSVRQWCGAVFRFAVSTMRADSNPSEALRGAMTRPAINHARALETKEISEYLGKLEKFGGNRTTGICLEVLLMTFVRSAEIRQARWEYFDLDAAVWRIPAEKMKMRRIHLVPLASQVVDLLRELKTITGGGEWLFPNTRRPRDVMSPTTINRALEGMGYATGKVTGHDFRATASTQLREIGYPDAHIDVQMAHAKKNKTESAYNHAQYLAERTRMMQDWADYVYSLGDDGKIVPIRAKFVTTGQKESASEQ
jgi:integrase